MIFSKFVNNHPKSVKKLFKNQRLNIYKHLWNIYLKTIESKIARDLNDLQNLYKNKIEIGSYPFFKLGSVGVAVVLRSINQKIINECYKSLLVKINKKKIKILNF